MTNDFDPRRGYYSAEIMFGPNLLDGIVNETMLTSYLVLLVDSCGSFLKNVGQLLVKKNYNETSCCDTQRYSLKVEMKLPKGADHFMIHGVQKGPLPFYVEGGVATRKIKDWSPVVATSFAYNVHGKRMLQFTAAWLVASLAAWSSVRS